MGEGDYWVDEKGIRFMTEAGYEHAERLLAERACCRKGSSLYDAANILADAPPECRPARHTLFHRTSTTSCRTAKWSSSTNSPVA